MRRPARLAPGREPRGSGNGRVRPRGRADCTGPGRLAACPLRGTIRLEAAERVDPNGVELDVAAWVVAIATEAAGARFAPELAA